MPPIIEYDIDQRSPQWFAMKYGVLGASQIHMVFTPGGQKSKQADRLMRALNAEYFSGEPLPKWEGNDDTERGTGLEPKARAFYGINNAVEVKEVGFIWKDERKMVGCSPDGLVGMDGGLEIKCPCAAVYMDYLQEASAPSKYYTQIQSSLWISDREWWDFLAFHPAYIETPIQHRLYRDEKYIQSLELTVECFIQAMEEKRVKLRKMGLVPACERVYER